MIPTAKAVPDLLRNTRSGVDANHKPIRVLICGIPTGVDGIVNRLHMRGFAQIGEWSRPLPSPIEGEVIRILTRHYEA